MDGCELPSRFALDAVTMTPMKSPTISFLLVVVVIGGCRRDSTTHEAEDNLRKLFDASIVYYDTTHFDGAGRELPGSFPQNAPLSPPAVPCGSANEPNTDDWNHPTWVALGFSISEPHYYSYRYESSGTRLDSQFTVYAIGDLDCDGVLSTFARGIRTLRASEPGGGFVESWNENE
jgi:hypothetical protein